MKQIKTIEEEKASVFDDAVNTELSGGWELVKRYRQDGKYIAELEQEELTEAERCCDNCKHSEKSASSMPCRVCEDASEWEETE